MIQSVCVYCGSSDRVSEAYRAAARQMGAALAQRGLRLVYGAGKTGLMGAVADGALAVGGQVTGVITTQFNTPALVHSGLTSLEVAETMHIRKARMADLADAFIALPGGYGTLDEFFEILTWAQIGLHSKPIGLLNALGYFEPLLAMIKHAENEGMIYSEHQALFVHADDPHSLLNSLTAHQPPEGLERWVNR